MSDELTPEERFDFEDEGVFVPRDITSGRDPEEIIADLVRLDWKPGDARAYVEQFSEELRQIAESPEARAELINRYFRQMIGGAVLGFVGLLLLLLMVVVAVGTGGAILLINVGLILSGAALFATGHSKWSLYRQHAADSEERDVADTFDEF